MPDTGGKSDYLIEREACLPRYISNPNPGYGVSMCLLERGDYILSGLFEHKTSHNPNARFKMQA